MKTSTKYINNHQIILVLLFLISAFTHAQLKNDFDPRFNEPVNGDFAMIANNMVSMDVTAPYNGTGNNDSFNLVYVDIDGNTGIGANTFNSSSAEFKDPAPGASCLTIKKVILYWAASDFEPIDGDLDSENQPTWDFDDIKLMLPGQTDYTDYDADEVIYRGRDDNGDGVTDDHFSNDPYVCVKDITTLVSDLIDNGDSPFGWYQIANVEGKIGNLQEPDFSTPTGVSGGWQIVFVYESPELTTKNISIYDGYAHVRNVGGQKDYDVTISGFQTVPSPQNVSAKILVGSLEGDRGYSGDKLQILIPPFPSTTYNDLSTDPTTPIRGTNNFFNSRITVDNNDFTDRLPLSTNTLGFDAAIFQLDNPGNSVIENNQTSATFRLTSTQETYGVFLLGLSVDVFEPNLGPIQVVTSASSVPQAPGSTIVGSFDVENKGNDDAQNVTIFSTLPPQLTLEEPLVGLPSGVAYTYNAGTGYLEFTVEDSYVETGDPAIEDVEFNLIIKDECYFLEDICNLSFGLEFTATYNGVINPVTQTTSSSSSVDACGVGNDIPTIINVIQPTISWDTATSVLDTTVECDDSAGLVAAQDLAPEALTPLGNDCNLTPVKTPGDFVLDTTCPNAGTYTNTWNFTDACGVTIADFTQVITLTDTTAPTIDTAASNSTVECDGAGNTTDLNTWLANNGGAVASDDCGGVTWSNDYTALSDDCGATGAGTVTFTATDACGLTSTTSATFTIEDTTVPSIDTAASDSTVECDGTGNTAALNAWLANNGGATASDDCSGVTWSNDFTALSDDCGATGAGTVTFTATDACGLTSTTSATFTIEDTTVPSIDTAASDSTVECDGTGNTAALNTWLANNGGALASDDCSGVTWSNDFTALSDDCGATGAANVTFTATDACGLTSTTSATFTIEDTTVPSIDTAASDSTVECDGSGNTTALNTWLANNGGATASDDCSGVTWSNDFTALSDDCGETGAATVTFTATDACGLTSTTSATFTIEDTTVPSIDTAASDSTVECDGTGNTAALNTWLANNGGAVASDDCGGVTWSNDYTALSDDCGATGAGTVTFTATDACGLTSTTSATFTIEDTTVPSIDTAASDSTVECDGTGNTAALNTWLANNGGALASDDCSGVTWSNDYTALSDDCGATGAATVTFTATDACGLTSTTSATFTIEDTTVPSIDTAASDSTVECDGTGNTAALNAWLANNGGATASDDCSGVTWSNDFTALSDDCGATGAANVTFTATDACGLTSTTSATFTIEDTTVPSIDTAASDSTVECDGSGNTTALNTWLANNGGALASDDCSGVTWSNDFTALSDDCGATGAANVTFTATDACGLTSTTSATFTIEDTTVPSIDTAASDSTVECDGTGNTAALNTWLANNGGAVASDDCGGVTWSNDFTALSDDCGETGAATVTFTATDACGLTSTTSATFTIEDTTVPSIDTAASDSTVECDGTGNTAALNAWLANNGGATASDDCSGVTWSNDFTALSDDCGETGAATVTFTATDACGLTSTTSATFTIEDTTVPSIDTAASDSTVECDGARNTTALNTWLANNGGATASDDCSGVTWSNDFTALSDDCGATGAGTVTFTATDACGLTSTTSATFTIEDTTVPSIDTAASDSTVECDGTGNTAALNAWLANNGGATASDDCSGVTWSNDFTALSDDCGATGAATVTFTATDACGLTSTTSATFTIEDTTVPSIDTAASDSTVECDGSGNTTALNTWLANNGGALASDDCSGVTWSNDFTALSDDCGATGAANVTFTATDACGLTSTTSATFTIEDTTVPSIDTAASDSTVECDGTGNTAALNTWLANNGGATASDDCSGVTWSNDFTALSDDCGETGAATVTFTATDACGLTSTTSATFTIEDTTVPSIDTAASDSTVECDGTGNTAALNTWLANNGGAVASDDCGGVTWSNDYTALSDDCGATGAGTVTFTATDACGLTSTTSATFTIEDTTVPSIDTAASDSTVECDGAGNTTALNTWLANNGGATASDDCSGVTWSNDYTALSDDCGATGAATVTFTATDACGLTSTTSATFTIEDTTVPSIDTAASDSTVECDGTGNTAALNAWLANNGGATASDDCSGVTWSNDFTALSDDCGATGAATVTFTATDACGLTSTTSATFTIEDTTVPSIDTAASDSTVECDGSGNTTALNTWLANNGGATASDDCSGVTWSNDFTALSDDCGETGAATVTFTATDACGLTSTTSATFTIEDTTVPSIDTAASDSTVECDGTGNTAALNTWLANNGGALASDDCSGVTWSNDFTALSDDCGATGAANVTFTATDACGLTSTTSATFTIEDTTVPSIDTAASDSTVECDGTGNTAALNTWLANNGGALASDDCSGVTWSNDFTALSDDCGATGAANVTFTATDACGLTSTTSATFTIEDTTVPSIDTAASDSTVECDGTGNTAALNTWLANNGGALASDDCSGVTWSNDFTALSDDCGATGAANVTFTATDACGLTSTTSATFTIEDTTVPSIDTAASDSTVECDGSGNTTALNTWLANNGGATASDDCSGVTWSNDFTALSDDCGATGAANVTFTATDACGLTSTTSATFTIEDTTVPSIDTAASDSTVECDGSGNTTALNTWLANNGGATASDDCSGVTWSNDFTALSDDCGETGAATVTFTATDACGLTSTTSATFTIEDTTVPSIDTAASDSTVECDGTGNTAALNTWLANNGGALASDDCSGVTWSNDFTALSDDCGATGAATVTFTATDACGLTSTTSATFTIEDTTVPTFTAPADIEIFTDANCNYDVTVALTGDVTDEADNCSTGIEATFVDSSPVAGACQGTYVITRIWSLVDDCNNAAADQSQTITISDNTAPTGTAPNDINGLQCIADVPVADIAAVTDEADNCSASVVVTVNDTDNGGTGCNGDPYIVTRTYTLTDCGGLTTDLVQTITVEDTTTYTGIAPTDLTGLTCDFADQAAVDTAFNDWITAQSTAIEAVMNGCSPVLTNNSASVAIPELCVGGTVVVEWTITNLCETIPLTANFILTAPVAVTYNAPADDSSTAAEFDDPDASVAQANLDADIAVWLATQNDAITNSVAGGCDPQISNDFVDQSISFCNSNSIIITWTVQDLCETTNPTGTYTFTQPDGINFNNPSSNTANACDFDDDDITVAQSNLDADIAAWVVAQNDVISNSLTGGSPEISHDFTNQSIDLCTGGSITVTWTIEDICETLTPFATYTLTPAAVIIYTDPVDANLQSCDFIAQADVNIAFNDWVTAQSTAISEANGCSPVLSNDSASASIPMLCNGGSTTVTWTITDLCETIALSADFNLIAADAVTYNNPVDTNEQSCEFADQGAVDIAFNDWVMAQSTAMAQAGGCAPILSNNSASVSIPMLCAGGSATVTWTITDLCETITVSADFNLEEPTVITFTNPVVANEESCDFVDQATVDTAFNDWVTAQSIAITQAGGCAPVLSNDSASASIPELCTGGSATVTWTITDLCDTIIMSADFNLTAPLAITYNNPVDTNEQSCDFADQAAVDTAFNDWITTQSAAIAETSGCAPVLSNDSASASIPELCSGGSVTVTWTITDLCQTNTVSADFNLTAPAAVTYTNPIDANAQSCDFANQAAVASAFNDWITSQSSAIAQAGGCVPVLSNNSASITIPELCVGGTVTVEWTITDLCETIPVTADFTITGPPVVSYDTPTDDVSNAAEFDDPDASVAQTNLDADIAAWVAAQTDVITNSIAGGCNPQISNDFVDQSINFCNSGSITITWTVQDLCETTNPSAIYTFDQPDSISYTSPNNKTVNTCDFDDDDDITVAQAKLDADIAAWIAAQNDIINNSLTGGSPEVSNDFTNQSIDLCTGGSIIIAWTIEDICETLTSSASYTLTTPEPVTYTEPVDITELSCDFANQAAVDTAFNNWVTAQSAVIAQAGGCSPVLSNNSASVAIPELCAGGTVAIEWTITDLCETIPLTAEFTLTPPSAVSYTAPLDDASDACEFGISDLAIAQSNLDADIAAWVTNETARINGSFAGGCNPTVTNDFAVQAIDFCTGGSISITWTITDLCETTNVSASYTFTQPEAPTFKQDTLPTDITVECDAVPAAEALTASNSCGDITVNFSETITDGSCPNSYSILRTWTATNICGTSVTNTQTITVQDNTGPVLELPANITAECSDDLSPTSFGTATAVDNCDDNPVITFNDVTTDGSCSGTFTITRTWTATDACGNVSSADQIISTIDTTVPEFDQTTLPGNIVVDCDNVPDTEILTATDNCGNAMVTVQDVRIDGSCPNSYTITRTYTATDECGVVNTHVQTITVQDTTPPAFVETLPTPRIVAQCDAVPVVETLTATDTCGSATVTVSDTRTNGNCPNNYTLARTWVATNACGLTTTYTQIIVVQDTTAPTFFESLPRDMTVECDDIPEANALTAIDNCGDAKVTISDVRTDGNCISNYTIARTWTATDECGLTTTHTQIIVVQDTTAPIPASTFAKTLDVSCTDIPEVPEVEFTDNCSANVIVEFDETNTFNENVIADYKIIRTWTVRDACNNEETYTQTLNVALDEILNEVVAEDRCFDDGVINLNDYLAEDTFGGTWEIIEGNTIATINGSIFDPTNLDSAYSESFNPNTDGMQYVLRYTGFQDGCINITDVIMIVDASCKVLPCGAKDVTISTAITPNGDDYNETFDIEGITLCGFVAEVKIFNRWGALVYESNEYTLGSEREGNAFGIFGKWNGTSPKSSIGNNGKLPNGTYYYIINLRNSGLDPITGPIYLGTK